MNKFSYCWSSAETRSHFEIDHPIGSTTDELRDRFCLYLKRWIWAGSTPPSIGTWTLHWKVQESNREYVEQRDQVPLLHVNYFLVDQEETVA